MDDYNEAVREVQNSLRHISRYNSNVSEVIPDGIYGEETKKSVSEFQKEYNLPQTGKVDYDTWVALFDELSLILDELAEPIQVAPIKNSDLPLKRNDSGTFMLTLQQMLNHVEQRFENLEKVLINGFFDDDTERAVKKWQYVCGHELSGVVDKDTWNSLAHFYLM